MSDLSSLSDAVTEPPVKIRAPQRPLGQQTRIPALDGVRGLAIILVMCWHYVRMPLFQNTNPILTGVGQLFGTCWSGVDLFFVLSGFLLGGILIDNRESSNYYRAFYVRRACRIFPVYYAWILLVACAGIFLSHGKLAPMFGNYRPLWPVLTYTQNFARVFFNYGGGQVFAVTWSLAIEEQFYLLLPLLIRVVAPRKLPFLLILLVLSGTVFRLLMWYFGPQQGWAGYVLLPCRWDSLFLGVLGAWLMRQPGFLQGARKQQWFIYGLMGTIAVGIIILRVVRQGNLMYLGMHELGFLWLAIFYLALIFLALTTENPLIKGIFKMRALGWLGTVSYGVYLIHQPVLWLFHILFGSGSPRLLTMKDLAITLLALVTSLLVASLSWRFFESPLVAWGRKQAY